MKFDTKSIFVAMVGKPNVGKSSLMNLILGEKIAIVTQKPQTTRTSITGILTKGITQFVFMDTPGIHTPKTKLGERMVKTSQKTIADVDLAVMLFEPYGALNEAELGLIENIKKNKMPSIAVINKKDTIKKEQDLEKQTNCLEELQVFSKIMVTSAKDNDGVDELLSVIESYATQGPHYFEDDAITNMPEKVIVSEIVREKLLLNMFEEIPHGTNVEVEQFKERKGKDMVDISVVIYCEKKSH
ncbi:MAG: GTPase Era, partial [Oscillospiraceae bacterium]